MEISEIEQIVKSCDFDSTRLTDKAETFKVVDGIVSIRKHDGSFNKARWEYDKNMGRDTLDMYKNLVGNTLEDSLAKFAIQLFALANKYNSNIQNIRLEADLDKNRTLDDLMYSMIKIAMSHYRPYKKIIILIGMLLGYCIGKNVDILWFVRKRLMFEKCLV